MSPSSSRSRALATVSATKSASSTRSRAPCVPPCVPGGPPDYSRWMLLGSAAAVSGGVALTRGGSQTGAVWREAPLSLSSDFVVPVTVTLSSKVGIGGSGFAVVLQRDARGVGALGAGAASLGVFGAGTYIKNAVAFTFYDGGFTSKRGVAVGAVGVTQTNVLRCDSYSIPPGCVINGTIAYKAAVDKGTLSVTICAPANTCSVIFSGVKVALGISSSVSAPSAILGVTAASSGNAWTHTVQVPVVSVASVTG